MKRIICFLLLLFSSSTGQSTIQTITCGTADDTPAAQAAIDADGIAFIGNGNCNIKSLNMTARFGLVLTGYGPLSTVTGIQSGVAIVDLTGASHPIIRNLRITTATGIIPQSAILNAQMMDNTGHSSASSDATRIEDVRMDGSYSIATHYDLGVASSRVLNSQIYNYMPGGITTIHTGNNWWGASSLFVQINTLNDQIVSDWDYYGTEMHNLGNGWAMWLGGVSGLHYNGGNISSSHIPVTINAIVMSNGVVYPNRLAFPGTTFYADFAPSPACAIKNNAGASGIPTLGYNPGISPVMC